MQASLESLSFFEGKPSLAFKEFVGLIFELGTSTKSHLLIAFDFVAFMAIWDGFLSSFTTADGFSLEYAPKSMSV